MGLLDFFKGEKRSLENPAASLSDFQDIVHGTTTMQCTREQAMTLPAVASCLQFIAGAVSGMPVRLYRTRTDGGKEDVDDYRTALLNRETGDTLDACQFKRAIVMDYLLDGAGYAVVNWQRNRVRSINYVSRENVSVVSNQDPVFKQVIYWIQARRYDDYQIFRILRDSDDGMEGHGILEENQSLFSTMFKALKYEHNTIGSGAKRGFLKSNRHLDHNILRSLRLAWEKLFSGDNPVVVLNDGLDFQEIGTTAMENQLFDNKVANNNAVYSLFGLPTGLFADQPSSETYLQAIRTAVLPIARAIENALNKFLLLESEKGRLFFVLDSSAITEADTMTRYQCYEIGLKNSWLTVDDIRKKENMLPVGMDYLKLGLDAVLYKPETGEIYTPNTGIKANINDAPEPPVETPTKGGEGNEGRDSQ
jgi:HK97 family phage portal protein